MIEILWAPTTQEPTGLHNDFKQKIKLNEKGKASEAAPPGHSDLCVRFPQ